jgi:putative peptide zinc metalloprotease protein
VLAPARRLLAPLQRAAQAHAGSQRRWRRWTFAGVLALVALLAVPLPQQLLVQGVVWPRDQAQLRSDEEGFIADLLARDGQTVAVGTPVLQLTNPRLQAELQRHAGRVAALEAQLFGALPTASAQGNRSGDTRAELAAAQAAWMRAQQRVDALVVRAQAAGQLRLHAAEDLQGAWAARGRLLGQVITPEPATVRLALPEAQARDLDLLAAAGPRSVSVRLASDPATAHPARLLRDAVGATRQLPSAALSQRHGGPVATEPQDKDALKPLQPVVLLDVQLSAAAGGPRLGERAWVRLDTGFAPLAQHLAEAARRHVLQRFNPAG